MGDYLGRKVFNYRKLFQVSDKSIENQFRSCWCVHWKILQLAHLQFHTQLLRECKLSNNISWRNVSWNTCPQYSISISLSLLYQFLSSFRFYSVLFPGCQRLLGLFNPNHPATDNNHEMSPTLSGWFWKFFQSLLQEWMIFYNCSYALWHKLPPSLHSTQTESHLPVIGWITVSKMGGKCLLCRQDEICAYVHEL